MFQHRHITVPRSARYAVMGSFDAPISEVWIVLPPELDGQSAAMLTRRAPITLVLGRQDEFATPELVIAQENRLKQLGVAHQTIRFDGGHEIDTDTLRALADKSPG